MNKKSTFESLKKFLLIATIILLVFCALVGIVAIFIGPKVTVFQLLSTVAIIYLITICCTNNASHISNSNNAIVQGLSVASITANILCGLPWIMLVWDVFGGLSVAERDMIWHLVGTMAVISGYCTVMADQVPGLVGKTFPGLLITTIPIAILTYLALDLFLMIWISPYNSDWIVGKFFLSEWILLLLQWSVGEILIHAQKGKDNQSQKN